MSQKNIDFMKKNNYQFKKLLTAPDDTGVVDAVQGLLSAQINATDTVIDAEMPNEMLTTDLNWQEGTPNDDQVKITKNQTIARKNINDDIIEQIVELTGNFPTGIPVGTYNGFETSLIIYDNKLIFGLNDGNIYYYDFETKTWVEDGTGPSNLGTALGTSHPVYSMVEYKGNLIVGSAGGRIAYYDGGSWHNYTSGGTYCSSGVILESSVVTTMVEYKGSLIIGGSSGRIASFDGTNWKNSDSTGTGTGIYDNNTHLTNNINDSIVYNNMLIFFGNSGEVASWDGINWKNSDGTGTGTGPGENAVTLYNINTSIIYDNTLVVADEGGLISSWDGTAWKYHNGTGTGTGIYHNFAGGYPIKKMLFYDNTLFFFHELLIASNGKIDTYDGLTWVENNIAYFNNNYLFGNEADINSQVSDALHFNGILYACSKENHLQAYEEVNGITNIYNSNPSTVNFINTTASAGTFGSGSTNLSASVVFDNKLIIGNSIGQVSFYDLITEEWFAYNSGTVPSNDGAAMGNVRIGSMIDYYGTLIIAGSSGRIASFDGTNWKNYDGTGTGTGPVANGTVVSTNSINTLIEFNYWVIIIGSSGLIGTWDNSNFTNNTGASAGTARIWNNATAFIAPWLGAAITYNNQLVIAGDMEIASCDSSNNWRNSDGTGTGGIYYDNGTKSGMGIVNAKSVFEYNGYLVISSDFGVSSCDRNNIWTNSSGIGNDPTGYIYASNSDFTSDFPYLAQKYDTSNPDFRFYQDKNNSFIGDTCTNLVTNPITLSAWSKIKVDVTPTGIYYLENEYFYVKTNTSTTSLAYAYSSIGISSAGEEFVVSFTAKRNTSNSTTVSIRDGSQWLGGVSVYFDTQSTNPGAYSTMLIENWIDINTVEIAFQTNGTLVQAGNICYMWMHSGSSSYQQTGVYLTQPQVISGRTRFPFVDGIRLADDISFPITSSTQFVVDMVLTVPAEIIGAIGNELASFVKVGAYYINIRINGTGDLCLYTRLDGGFELGAESIPFLGKRVRLITLIDTVNISYTNQKLIVIDLEADTAVDYVNNQMTIGAYSGTIDTVYIGQNYDNTRPANANIEYIKIYNDFPIDTVITNNADADALFPKEGYIVTDMSGNMGSFDGDNINSHDSGNPLTITNQTSDSFVHITQNDNTLYLFKNDEKIEVMDLNTGSYSDIPTRIVHN